MFTRLKTRVYKILSASSESPKGWSILGGLSFLDSSLLPIPFEIFLVPFLLAARTPRWFFTFVLVTATSVLGGLLGYAIGVFLYESVGVFLISLWGLENEFADIQAAFDRNVFWAVFVAGLTPVPYKMFTIGAGVLGASFPLFILASILSRALRFLIIVYGLKYFGRPVALFIARRVGMATVIGIVLTALIVLVIAFNAF